MTSTISTADLRRRLADPDLTIVDLRPMAAFNGWRLGREARGGHIRGAVAFPGEWLASEDAAGDRAPAQAQGHHAGSVHRVVRR